MNWQVSTFVFLYRVLERKEEPEVAYRDVAKVWSPAGAWRQFLVTQLRRNGIAFEPY